MCSYSTNITHHEGAKTLCAHREKASYIMYTINGGYQHRTCLSPIYVKHSLHTHKQADTFAFSQFFVIHRSSTDGKEGNKMLLKHTR